jgi:tetratricopeptide (TPR) repeat protein
MAQSRYAEGFIRCVEGRHQEGYQAMDRATRLDPNFAAAHAQKANQLVRLGNAKAALPIAHHAIKLASPPPADPALISRRDSAPPTPAAA